MLLLPPPWFPCHLGSWYSATACRSRAQGSRKAGSSPKIDIETVLFMSVLLSPLQHRLNTTDRSRTTSVSQDKFKFVPPSLSTHIARGISCSASRGSRRSVSRQHHTHAHTHKRAYTHLPLPLLLFTSFHIYIHTYISAPASCLAVCLPTWPSISEKVRLHLPPVGIGQPFYPIFRATPCPPCDSTWTRLGSTYLALGLYTTHTHAHAHKRARSTYGALLPAAYPRSFWLPL